MVSVWEWVGIVLGVYGIIILFSTFIYSEEGNSYVGNPSFWWGGFMLGFALLMYYIGKRSREHSIEERNSESESKAVRKTEK